MSTDRYEGTLYNLPKTLSWEMISNLEGLTSVEINCMVGKTVVPMEAFLKAIRSMNLINRSIEEERMVQEELSHMADFYLREHAALEHAIADIEPQSTYECGCLNLLHHRLLFNEMTLMDLSKCYNIHLPIIKFCNFDTKSCYHAHNSCVPEPNTQSSDDSSDSDVESSDSVM